MEISPFNGLKCLAHAEKIQDILAGAIPYPVCAQIDLSNVCNHNCLWCYYGFFRRRAPILMRLDKALALINELASLGTRSILFTGGGEPLTHPQITTIIRAAHALDLKIGMSTNGGLLDTAVQETLLECNTYVRISLDAGTEEVHERLHAAPKGDYRRILSTVKKMSRTKKGPPIIGYAFLVCDENVTDIEQAVVNAMENGFDYIQFRPVIGRKMFSDIFLSIADDTINNMRLKYAGYPILGNIKPPWTEGDEKKGFCHCRITPLLTIIGPDLKVYLCCQWRGNLNYVVGDVSEKSFKDIWGTTEHRELISRIDINRCRPCKYAKYNTVIEQVFIKDAMHRDFL